ncbi:nucleotidyltransferase family protein [Extibacter muris]|uniref:nucleotidyltransferase family protein n=1 Tax=Extibacter muris TaxID=1796622 RepID=UPI001D090666|nr:sugar phosphate nucleotidyltransferase [Extibacter muris]MCB6201568.1 nucleotidyltransferase [Extibacter muris]MCQ4662894.1 sugar phosphate nucleotidyltransferase [Extibacter muris]MCQ4694192.1 sugar phosphate nucleotidyltransferase [Extibacter muris]
MGKATLVVMAAGIGSRYSGGIKQLEPVGPSGEIIMDYSIYDALEAGFDKVVFVIRRDLEKDFKEIIGKRIEKIVEVAYVFQELEDIPIKFRAKFKNRLKPWGTGQAVLCCKDVVHEPFVVINADDYYGKEAFSKAYDYLMTTTNLTDRLPVFMVGFILGNTLSKNGSVTRGICTVGEDGMLLDIVETHQIEKRGNKAVTFDGDFEKEIDIESIVSMNMWGLYPRFFDMLEEGFEMFVSTLEKSDLKSEYLLPVVIGDLLKQGMVNVHVLQSSDEWFGVTYKEDRQLVVEAIRSLILQGEYPESLYVDGNIDAL